jgi:hypothetical protein
MAAIPTLTQVAMKIVSLAFHDQGPSYIYLYFITAMFKQDAATSGDGEAVYFDYAPILRADNTCGYKCGVPDCNLLFNLIYR